MTGNIDLSLIDWSRAQFALTAMYHWLFVPLTLGLAFIIAIMETQYVRTGKQQWKDITKFWMTLFGINFVIGVATGIILEFEFGTNWSNYSWFVGDIFGAPLAIEGIMAFFLESTFIAVMFFGWNKVGKKFHLFSTWMVFAGANLSALWILVANAWMQFPTGMHFNPDTARNEMTNFWQVLFSPVAMNKFFHTVTSAYVLAAIFVIGVSSWLLLKKRSTDIATKSIRIAAIFGLVSSLLLAWTGDGSAFQAAQKQPMKLAAMEGLYHGQKGAPLVLAGIVTPGKKWDDNQKPYVVKIEAPRLLSILSYRNSEAFVPGIDDIIKGGYPMENKGGEIALPAEEKIARGKAAIAALGKYKNAKEAGDTLLAAQQLIILNKNFAYFGYGYLNSPSSLVPNVPLTFYSFHIMVILGFFFILLFIVVLFFLQKKKLERQRWLLWISLLSIPLAYLASQMGWIVAELGRQPWTIQDLLPTMAAVSNIDAGSVQLTFWLFAVLFTTLLIAEIKIMTKQIKLGPKDGGQ